MAEVIRYVNTDASAGGDGTTSGTTGANRAYATLDEWHGAEVTDLVGAGDNHVVKCLGSAVHTGRLTIAGWGTSETNDLHITIHEDRRHTGVSGTSDCRMEPGSDGHVFTINDNFVEISYFEITDWTGSSSEAFRINSASGHLHHLMTYQADNTNGQGDAFFFGAAPTSGLWKIDNCMGWEIERGYIMLQNTQNIIIYAYNCSAIDCGDDGSSTRGVFTTTTSFDQSNIQLHCKNCVASGRAATDNGFKGGGSTGNEAVIYLYNCVDGNATGSFVVDSGGNRENVDFGDAVFEAFTRSDATQPVDLHLKTTDTILTGSGLDLSADAINPISTDIDGEAIGSPWNIGADQPLLSAGDVFDTHDGTYRGIHDADTGTNLFGYYRMADGKMWMPVVDTLAEVTSPADNQLVFIGPSGKIAAYDPAGSWKVSAQGYKTPDWAPPSSLFHFPQSGYEDTGNEYPVNNDIVDSWRKTHDSSGLVIGAFITTPTNREVTFRNSTGGAYGKLELAVGLAGTEDAFLHNGSNPLYGGTDVCTFGMAFRTPNADNDTIFGRGLFTFLTDVGGFNIHAGIRPTSGTFRVGFHDGTNFCQAHSTCSGEANTNYTLIGVLKSDGDIKIYINGVDDTFNKTNTFSGQIRTTSHDLVIGASDASYNSHASGYFITDFGVWFRDFEATDEVAQLHSYLAKRTMSLDGS